MEKIKSVLSPWLDKAKTLYKPPSKESAVQVGLIVLCLLVMAVAIFGHDHGV